MKCIQCGTDNALRDRTANQGRCKQCQHPFVFEPTTMGETKITDPLFAKAISDVSANNMLFFTPKQFFYSLEKRVRIKTTTHRLTYLFIYIFLLVWVTGFFGGFIGHFTRSFIPTIIVMIVANIVFIASFFNATKSSKISPQSRRNHAKNLQTVGGIILVGGCSASLFLLNSFLFFVISVLLGMLAIYLGTIQLRKRDSIVQDILLEQSQVQGWLENWERINNPIQKILPPPREQQLPATIAPDVTAYSFDRLVVCDNANIAQMLIANNFHFENNCAILSITGYPQSIFDITMQMLRRNPNLQVYALHDCSLRGVSLVHHLRSSPNWFQNSNFMIFDVGLLPRQIFQIKDAVVRVAPEPERSQQIPEAVRQELSQPELEWLESGKIVELESFTPQRIIQVLNRSISGSRDFASDDGAFIFIGDAGSSVYAAESFG